MHTRLVKWGNSLGLRIPKAFVREAHVAYGSEVDLSLKKGLLIVKPIRPPKRTLKQLLAKVKPENLHTEADFGMPSGKELI